MMSKTTEGLCNIHVKLYKHELSKRTIMLICRSLSKNNWNVSMEEHVRLAFAG